MRVRGGQNVSQSSSGADAAEGFAAGGGVTACVSTGGLAEGGGALGLAAGGVALGGSLRRARAMVRSAIFAGVGSRAGAARVWVAAGAGAAGGTFAAAAALVAMAVGAILDERDFGDLGGVGRGQNFLAERW